MKFLYYFPGRWKPLNRALMSGRVHIALARACEEVGFDGVCLDEHPAPVEAWLATPGGHHSLDPFVGLAAIAGATTRLKLLTYLAVLPYRNPFMFAKTATTLDVMSDGRLMLGVGVGYMKGEFEALGLDHDQRNARFDEALEVFRLACTGEPVTYRGSGFNAEGVVVLPEPVQRPHPPIWFGGNSKLSRRRAAEFGQGWLPMPQKRTTGHHKTPPLETIADLAGLLGELRDYCDQIGRAEPMGVGMSAHIFPPDDPFSVHLEKLQELKALGVTHVTVNGTGRDAQEAEDFVRRYGEEIIRRFPQE